MASQFTEARDAVAMALRLEPDNERAQKLNDHLSHDPRRGKLIRDGISCSVCRSCRGSVRMKKLKE